MKQIKAFMHPHRITAVVEALRNSGLCDISAASGCYNLTVSTVQRLFTSSDPAQQHYSMVLAEPVVAETKLELICEDHLADQLQHLIVQAAKPSAGWVFVSDILSATKLG
ncbi:P-II family nitrogen regulator [Undibacterium sp. Jales W-56]|uniref:P-II family nitrogen regulator n=1 Tax=Undibacterium sp. Jales W-56 TaxID=2897325 RepID=UPI0021D2EE1A|nr:P-II family nitrogen regulator [Undibacterium sp. Jales W-56]MCU6435300.1 P-II family nitrogen regulator [Undibacterium sp. Jales W-56]